MKQSTALAITIIMTVVVTTFIVVGFQILEEQKEVREAEIFVNGTMLGQAQLIQGIQTNGIIPYFNSTGHLNTITFSQLCTQLNQGGK